ncbi:hypothetical protein ACMAUO_07625 [Gluconacetobacter sp. Hr-1-5]|uniref:hypothetical protein n=1 Tax=Gluconacetobacter sp. Hr-1-5 TaxID=3395370 RepID=UPI003B51D752
MVGNYTILFLSIVFFIPTILSLVLRKTPFKEALTLNVTLGFTWAGWISTILWCATGDKSRIKTKVKSYPLYIRVLIMAFMVVAEILLVYAIARHS